MYRLWIGLGGLAGLGAVGMAAVAAHLLTDSTPLSLHGAVQLRAVDSAVQMQGWHALALLAVGLWAERHPGRLANLAGAGFTLGLLAFCGAVYSSALAGINTGPLAPVGGTLLMLGWVLLGVSAFR